jgi:hypothetical protein
MKPLTRFSVTVAGPRNLSHWLRHGLTSMLAQPSGPVHLSLTHDALTADCAADYVPVSNFFTDVAPLSQPAAEQALGALARAQRIVLLAGAGIEHDNAAAALKAAAERWSIPVATTLRAKGVFPEDHDLSLGVFGYAGTRHATAALFDPDLEVLLILGSGLNERDTMHWTLRQKSEAQMIHVNTDMWEMTSHGKANHVVPAVAVPSWNSWAAPPALPRLGFRRARPHVDRRSPRRRPDRGFTTSRIAGARPNRSIPPRRSRRCAQFFRATAFCSSIPARTARLPAIIGPPTNRGAIFRRPISGPWAGRSPRP